MINTSLILLLSGLLSASLPGTRVDRQEKENYYYFFDKILGRNERTSVIYDRTKRRQRRGGGGNQREIIENVTNPTKLFVLYGGAETTSTQQ